MATRQYEFITGPETSTLPTVGTPTDDTDLITKGYADLNYMQGRLAVADLAALKALDVTTLSDKHALYVEGMNTLYAYDFDSVDAGDDNLVVQPTVGAGRYIKIRQGRTGDLVGTSDTQTLTAKTVLITDTNLSILDGGDPTKIIKFDAANVPTATTNTYTTPSISDELVGKAATQTLTNKTLTNPVLTTNGTLSLTAGGTLDIAATATILTLGGGSTSVVIPGNLEVQGTTTTLNTATLDVEDTNITVNKGGTAGSANGAGITADQSTGTPATILQNSSLASRWKIGASGSEAEVATVSHLQVITNKDIDGGTAANDHRITLPKNTTTNLNALTRKEGTLVYDTTTGQVKFDTGATLTALAGTGTATPTVQGSVTSYFAVIQSSVLTDSSSATITITTTDGIKNVYAARANVQTIALPAVADNIGRDIEIENQTTGGSNLGGGQDVTIDPNGSEVIIGSWGSSTTNILKAYGAKIRLHGTSAGWVIKSVHDELFSKRARSSPLGLVATQADNIVSISTPAGVWYASAIVGASNLNGRGQTVMAGEITTTSATYTGGDSKGDTSAAHERAAADDNRSEDAVTIAPHRIVFSSTTTLYLVGFTTQTSGTSNYYGTMRLVRRS